MKSRIFTALAILCILSVPFGYLQYEKRAHPTTPQLEPVVLTETAKKLANGLIIREVMPSRSDMDWQHILSACVYRFEVEMPKAGQFLGPSVEVREKGKKPEILCGLGYGPLAVGKHSVLVSFLPVDDTLLKAKKIRCSVLVDHGGGSSEVRDNPFYGCNGGSTFVGRMPDDSYFLLGGVKAENRKNTVLMPDNDVTMVLVFKIWPAPIASTTAQK